MAAKQILIIDDDQGILGAIRAILEDEGYQITTSENSNYLNKLNLGNMPDLILLDLFVSGEDGKEILKKVKGTPLTKNLPVIMLSAFPNVEKELKDLGADDFISKPFDIDDLIRGVDKFLK